MQAQAIDKTQALFTRLEEGLAQLLESGDWKNYLLTQSKFHRYSFRNILLVLFQKPNASRLAGYRTWQELGRQVKKGEKAIQILAPLKRKLEQVNEQGETETDYVMPTAQRSCSLDSKQFLFLTFLKRRGISFQKLPLVLVVMMED